MRPEEVPESRKRLSRLAAPPAHLDSVERAIHGDGATRRQVADERDDAADGHQQPAADEAVHALLTARVLERSPDDGECADEEADAGGEDDRLADGVRHHRLILPEDR